MQLLEVLCCLFTNKNMFMKDFYQIRILNIFIFRLPLHEAVITDNGKWSSAKTWRAGGPANFISNAQRPSSRA